MSFVKPYNLTFRLEQAYHIISHFVFAFRRAADCLLSVPQLALPWWCFLSAFPPNRCSQRGYVSRRRQWSKQHWNFWVTSTIGTLMLCLRWVGERSSESSWTGRYKKNAIGLAAFKLLSHFNHRNHAYSRWVASWWKRWGRRGGGFVGRNWTVRVWKESYGWSARLERYLLFCHSSAV